MKVKNGIKIFIKNEAMGKYLFILRDNKSDIVEPNMWGLVGGGIDENEDLISKIKEKTKKEVGIEIFDIKQIHQMPVTHTLEEQEYIITGVYFIAKTNATLSDINLTKGQKASFFSLDEIKSKDNVAFAVREILSKHKHLLQ